MFVQKRGNDWLLLEWRSDGGPIRPVILGVYPTQDDAVLAMQKLFIDCTFSTPLAERGFGVKDCAC